MKFKNIVLIMLIGSITTASCVDTASTEPAIQLTNFYCMRADDLVSVAGRVENLYVPRLGNAVIRVIAMAPAAIGRAGGNKDHLKIFYCVPISLLQSSVCVDYGYIPESGHVVVIIERLPVESIGGGAGAASASVAPEENCVPISELDFSLIPSKLWNRDNSCRESVTYKTMNGRLSVTSLIGFEFDNINIEGMFFLNFPSFVRSISWCVVTGKSRLLAQTKTAVYFFIKKDDGSFVTVPYIPCNHIYIIKHWNNPAFDLAAVSPAE